ncbi:glycosyltransferase [Rhodohalobacter barkolensis]|uniref:Glycosyl transferase family 1 domain-containing protein n=1 Tax=Rhodohalobacter barkolensis TaxID=2053187 RepID=A0A2N0VKF8_9BACT|nr:glycosyltransferase [Rhodohalobacter barkolensis]PKD44649.1 hypothetical protein CWD77_04080 [Rhodohalobacter barkolensis]
MKILLNASTINVGGGLFVTINFIKESLTASLEHVEWHYLISEVVDKELNIASVNLPQGSYSVINRSPAKIISRKKTLRKINEVEKRVSPDIVYSIGAPSYVSFDSTEALRLTNGLITHLNSETLSCYGFIDRQKFLTKSFIQQKIVGRSKYFVTQSDTAKRGILKLTGESPNSVKVIPNSISKTFQDYKTVTNTNVNENFIFCLAAPYPHKNIDKIPLVAHGLKESGYHDFKFILTLPEGSKVLNEINQESKKLKVSDHILNVGKLTQKECAEWYEKSSVVFLPTYLETFSATLLEALFMETPIVTTDFSFNKDVCDDYAAYFKPGDWRGASEQIDRILSESSFRNELIMPKKVFEDKFKSFRENYLETVEFLNEVYEKES